MTYIVQNVLYLMIVNMHPDEEIAAATQVIKKAQKGHAGGQGG